MAIWYYVDKTSGYNNNHVVHAAHCHYLPKMQHRLFLGTFYNPVAAIQQARKYYSGAMGCAACCPVNVKKNLTEQNSVALKHMVKL